MASTRESSPALSEAGSRSGTPLTPTSKVKALLAGLDSDSEDDASADPRGDLKAVLKNLSASAKVTPDVEGGNFLENAPKPTNANPADSSDDDEEIVQPKGRMAARMQAAQDGSESDDVDVRSRVRKMLAARSKSSTTEVDDDGDDESDAPVLPRRRKIQHGLKERPKSSPAKGPTSSPGLFVSPTKPECANSPDGSDSDDLPQNPVKDDRFMALVAKKRKEREERDAEAAKEKAKKLAEKKRYTEMFQEDDNMSDEEGNRRLTQQNRPTRKASKRAIEEINRESQRISRNQQLAHQAVTKKKITKASLFEKFNFRTSATPEVSRPASSSSATAPHSDDTVMKDTPPTSPASHHEAEKDSQASMLEPSAEVDEELPTLEEVLATSSPPRMDKGKGKAIEEPVEEVKIAKRALFTQRPIKIHPPKSSERTTVLDDSDSDLEIVTAKTPKLKKRLDAIFDNVPANQSKENQSLHVLRMLAHLGSHGKSNTGRNKKPSMTTSELAMSLQQKARQQAVREREERLQALRDKGIIIQTAEEREKEMIDVDDILAAARREQDELAQREKVAAKKERKENGEADPLGDDSSDDEDWEETKDVPEEDLSVSGSEDEEASAADSGGEEEGVDADEQTAANPLFDNEASEDEDEEVEGDADEMMEEAADSMDVDEEETEALLPVQRRVRKSNVISDDEDEDEVAPEKTTPEMSQFESPLHPKTISPVKHTSAPNSVLRSATKTFIPGLPVSGPAGLGLTQIFNGTMDESQMGSVDDASQDRPMSPRQEPKPASMSFLKRFAAPELPPFIPTMSEDTQEVDDVSPSQVSHVPQSQSTEEVYQGVDLHFSQSQIYEFSTQDFAAPELTQDVGLGEYTPIKGRFAAPPSTVDTVLLDTPTLPDRIEESPVARRKGKLRRRAPQVAEFSDEEESAEPGLAIEEDDFDITADAFNVMKKASKKKAIMDDFDKKKSEAKEMVYDQAEESDDEYAGLGGASDDESGGEEDAFVKEMINDEAGQNVDDSKLAAFYADRERANDEKQVEKLFKDITNGMLRRKRGADLDLSDSDDGGEAKKRRKRKEFAKMRNALLADERIGKIAENPKRQAFLRAIEDRGSEDEMDFLEDFAEQEETQDSQSQSQSLVQGESQDQMVPDSQPTDMGPPKRKRSDEAEEAAARLPPNLRRTKPAKKPSNLSEIRQSLSSLIEEPNSIISTPMDSDSESDLEIIDNEDLGPGYVTKEKENRDPFALRRTNVPIIDRSSLKRQSSSSASDRAKLAFSVNSNSQGFKVPALLRRATTNSSILSTSSVGGVSGTERSAGANGECSGVRRGGGKGSGINYFARESERRAVVAKREGRREEKLVRGAKARSKVAGGLFGGGKFE